MKCRNVNPKLSPCLRKYRLLGPLLPGGNEIIPVERSGYLCSTCVSGALWNVSYLQLALYKHFRYYFRRKRISTPSDFDFALIFIGCGTKSL